MKYTDISEKVSQVTGLPVSIVEKTYRAYWKCIKDRIQDLKIKEEGLEESVSFNIPKIGKLFIDKDKTDYVKSHFNKGEENDKYKED